jgi:chloramphenicol 3-O phosphotransferase
MVAHIVLLNGVGSAGKTSIAKALQSIARVPLLHVQMDAFLDMLPEAMIGHPDGLVFEPIEQDGKPVVAIKSGPVAERAFRGMRHTVAALAAQGNDLVVDEVLLGTKAREYAELLSPFRLHWVGIFAPLDVLEARERQRGDRLIGLARWQYDRVHQNTKYDLELDTSRASPKACAELIRDAFRL